MMNLRELALTAKDSQIFIVKYDDAWHELTRADVLNDNETGARGVIAWSINSIEDDALEVECGVADRENDWISVTEAAEILGVHRNRVLQLVNAGNLDGQKIGNTWSIDRASVEARAANPPSAGRRW